jgi:outer membrane receptor for monomeric catechols
VRASDAGYVPREYDPDKVNNYELGNKSTFWNGRLRLNATAYLMKWDDIQQQRWNDGPLWWQNGTINGGKAESKGIELYASVYLTDQLRFSANISAGSAEYTDAILEADGSVNTPEGTDMPYAPDYKYWFGISITRFLMHSGAVTSGCAMTRAAQRTRGMAGHGLTGTRETLFRQIFCPPGTSGTPSLAGSQNRGR